MKLSEKQKQFLVVQHAIFHPLREIRAAFKEEFDIEITASQAAHYDPFRTWAGKSKLSGELLDLFDETRACFLEKISNIAVANQAYRLTVLQDLLEKQLQSSKPNNAFILSILEQAAKESGGHFTNRRELSGPGGKPIETVSVTLDQWKEQAARREHEATEIMQIFDENFS